MRLRTDFCLRMTPGAAATTTAPTSPIPTDNLALWLKGDSGVFQLSNGTTPAVALGDPVGYWTDNSPALNNATQATGGNKPTIGATLNGLNTVAFANQWLSLTAIVSFLAASDATYYEVGTTPAQGSPWAFLARSSDSSSFGKFNQDGVFVADGGGNFIGIGATGFPMTAGVSIMARGRHVAAGTSYSYKVNGQTEKTSFGPVIGDLNFDRVGTGNGAPNASGTVGEIVVYTRALTGAEQTQVETYLSGRWGVSF